MKLPRTSSRQGLSSRIKSIAMTTSLVNLIQLAYILSTMVRSFPIFPSVKFLARRTRLVETASSIEQEPPSSVPKPKGIGIGSYIDKLMKGEVTFNLPSYNSVAPQTTADTMSSTANAASTTLAKKSSSYAPTKPHVKGTNSTSGFGSGYVEQLKRAVSSLAPNSYSYSSPMTSAASSTSFPAEASSVPWMSDNNANHNQRKQSSFAPTKPNVKAVSGSSGIGSGGYTEQLKRGTFSPSSQSRANPATPSASQSQPTMASPPTWMSGTAASNVVRKPASYAPTRSSVKAASSISGISNSGSYMEQLKRGGTINTAPATSQPVTTSASSSNTASHVGRKLSTYAPTKPNVKAMGGTSGISSGSYMEQLKRGDSSASSETYEGIVTPGFTSVATPQPLVTPVPWMSSNPATSAGKKLSSYAPTKANVKVVNSSSGLTSGSYIEQLKRGENTNPTAPDSQKEAASTTQQPLATSIPWMSSNTAATVGKKLSSYAPTKSNIKAAVPSGIGTGSYIEQLKRGDTTRSPQYSISNPEVMKSATSAQQTRLDASSIQGISGNTPSSVARTMSSYAPTKPNIKTVSGISGVSNESYMEQLKRGDITQSTSYDAAAETHNVVAGSSTPWIPSNAAASVGKKLSSYAPTKPSVKGTNSTSGFGSGSYVDQLKRSLPLQSASAYESTKTLASQLHQPVSSSMPWMPRNSADIVTKKASSYAPTKPNVKVVSSIAGVASGSYMEQLKLGGPGNTPGYVSAEPETPRAASFASQQPDVSSIPWMSASAANNFAGKKVSSYAPTKPEIKAARSSSGMNSGGYMEKLKQGDTTPSPTYSVAATETEVAPVASSMPWVSTNTVATVGKKLSSYAPTKPNIKVASSTTGIGGGSYLERLRRGDTTVSPFYNTAATETANAPVPVSPQADISPFARIPANMATNVGKKPSSYAPTKPNIKSVSTYSGVNSGSYLEQLKRFASTFYPSPRVDSPQTPKSAPSEPQQSVRSSIPSTTSSAFSSVGRKVGTYAPTKQSIKFVSATTGISSGSYLEQLKVISQVPSMSINGEYYVGKEKSSFAPTQPIVKILNSANGIGSGSYMEQLSRGGFVVVASPSTPYNGSPSNPTESTSTHPALSTVQSTSSSFIGDVGKKLSMYPLEKPPVNTLSSGGRKYMEQLKQVYWTITSAAESKARSLQKDKATVSSMPLMDNSTASGISSYQTTKANVKVISNSVESSFEDYMEQLKKSDSTIKSNPTSTSSSVQQAVASATSKVTKLSKSPANPNVKVVSGASGIGPSFTIFVEPKQ